MVIFLLVLLISNTIQVITGFAGSLIAMPFGMKLVEYQTLVTVLNVFILISSFIITIQNRKYIQWKTLLVMVSVMILGVFTAILMLDYFKLSILKKFYGAMILLIALKKLFIKKELDIPKWLMILSIFLAGVIHGLFLSGGALLVIFAVSALPDKNEFRATVAPVWVILNSILVFQHVSSGFYTPYNMKIVLFSLIPLVLSIYIGNKLCMKINQKSFLKITYALLVISGITALI